MNKSSKILDDDLLDQVAAAAPLKVKKEASEVQRQVVVYDVPKAWIKAVKEKAGGSMSNFIKVAVREKLERDGHL